MARKMLGAKFFERRAPIVAKELLGKFLVRKIPPGKSGRASPKFDLSGGKKEISYMITETEAYTGRDDMSSHAANGITKRNKVMFGPPGRWYVYFIYGMYHCLNIVTEKDGKAGAVLIRGVENCNGPGKLCRALAIKLDLYGKPAVPLSGLWIEDRGISVSLKSKAQNPRFRIKRTSRVNIGGDEKAKKRLWRFILVSKCRHT